MCLRRGGGEMALVTARPPPPAALAPLLRGLLSVSKLSLGSGTAKSQRSGRCLPSPSPRGSQLPGAGRRGDGERAVRVFKFHGAHPPRKRRSGRGRNGAFNVHTQPVPHFPGKNQTSVEIPHTLASFPVSPEPEGHGLQRKPGPVPVSIPRSPHTEETVTAGPTQGLWRPSWRTLVHRCVSQPRRGPSEHPVGPDRCYMGWWPTWHLLCQEVHQKEVITVPNGPKKLQLKQHHRRNQRVSHGDAHHSVQRANHEVIPRAAIRAPKGPTNNVSRVEAFTAPHGPPRCPRQFSQCPMD